MELLELLRKPIDKITFDDVVAFCSTGTREHVLLDYKLRFGADDTALKIARVISSFANTQGGLVLYGVPEERDGFPERAPKGAPLGSDARQTIRNACAQKIWPPLSPEVSDFPPNPADPSLGFVVVKVSEGLHVPYTVNNFIYVRVMDSSEPKAPSLDIISSLLLRRKGLEAAQEQRRTRLVERLEWYFTEGSPVLYANPPFGLWVVTGPQYLATPACTIDELEEHVDASTGEGTIIETVSQYGLLAVHDGFQFIGDTGKELSTLSVDIYGNSVLYDRNVAASVEISDEQMLERQHRRRDRADGRGGLYSGVDVSCLAQSIWESLQFARSFSESVGGTGTFVCRLRVNRSRGLPLVGRSRGRDDVLATCLFDNELEVGCEVGSSDNIGPIAEQLFKRIVWAWGCTRPMNMTIAQNMAMT